MLKRLQSDVDEKLQEEQAGFRHHSSCNEQIFTLRNIIEQSLEYKSLLIVHYVDFQKAFDYIHRLTLWKIIRTYGIPQKYIDIFKELYDNSQCCMKTNSGFTDFFKVKTSVQQGDIPSLFFFIITIDYIMFRAMDNPQFGVWWRDTRLTDLDFADDLALIAEKCDVMQSITGKLSGLSEKVGLRISKKRKKSKNLVISLMMGT